jgi:hypothetical protein
MMVRGTDKRREFVCGTQERGMRPEIQMFNAQWSMTND